MKVKKIFWIIFLLLGLVATVNIGCANKNMPKSPMEETLVLDEKNRDRSKDVLDEIYQKEYFTPEELQQLAEFDSGYDPNDVFQALGEKKLIGTVVHLQRVNDIYLDGYAFFQKGVKSVKLKVGYTQREFDRVYFKGRKMDFYILRRIQFPRNPQTVKVIIESEDNEIEEVPCLVPYIVEIKGLVDSMNIDVEKKFDLGVIGDGKMHALIYNKKPASVSIYKDVRQVNYVHKSVESDKEYLIFEPDELSILKPGLGFVSINAKTESNFQFLGIECKVVAIAVEPLIPIMIKNRYAD